jgi:hypothetical protein
MEDNHFIPLLDRIELPMQWWDFVAQDFVELDEPTTDEQAKRFIPQWPPALSLYDAYRANGEDILHALIKTLGACVAD